MISTKQLLVDGKPREALSTLNASLSSYDEREFNAEQRQFRDKLMQIAAREAKLLKMLRDAKADGILEPREIAELFEESSEYLQLDPTHPKIFSLHTELKRKISESPEMFSGFTELREIWKAMPLERLLELPDDKFAQIPEGTWDTVPRSKLEKLPVSSLARFPDATIERTFLGVLLHAKLVADKMGLLGREYFLLPDIPEAKIKTAIDVYANGTDPSDVLILCDNTVMHSGKKGLLMTREYLYWRDRTVGKVRLREIREVNPVPRPQLFALGGIVVNGVLIDVNGPSVEATNNFIELVICVIAGMQELWGKPELAKASNEADFGEEDLEREADRKQLADDAGDYDAPKNASNSVKGQGRAKQDSAWVYDDYVIDISEMFSNGTIGSNVRLEDIKAHWWSLIRPQVLEELQEHLDDGWEPVASLGSDCLVVETKARKPLFGATEIDVFPVEIRIQMRRKKSV